MFSDRKVVDNSFFAKDNREAALFGYLFNSLQDKDYYIYQMLYNKLKLNDNKRLLEQLGNTYSFSYKIEQNVYLDMANIFIQEIIYNENDEVRILLEDYALEKYNIMSDRYLIKMIEEHDMQSMVTYKYPKDKTKTEFISYLIFTYGLIMSDRKIDVEEFLTRNSKVSDKLRSYYEILEDRLDFSNAKENKLLSKYITRTLKKYLESNGFDELAGDIYECYNLTEEPFPIDMMEFLYLKSDDSAVGTRFLIQKLLEKNQLSSTLLFSQDEDNKKEIMEELFEMYCLTQLACKADDEEIVLSNIIRRAEIDVTDITKNLLYMYFIDKLCALVQTLLKEQYSNFSFKGNVVKTDSQILQEKITKLEEEIERKNTVIQNQSEEINVLKDKLLKDKKVEERPYIEQIADLQKQILNLQKKNDELQEYRKSTNEFIDLLQTKEEQPQIDNINLYDKKLLLVGGLPEVIRKFQDKYIYSKWLSNETDKVDVCEIQYILIFYEYMSHALYYKVIDLARKNNIPVIYIKGTNIDRILNNLNDAKY